MNAYWVFACTDFKIDGPIKNLWLLSSNWMQAILIVTFLHQGKNIIIGAGFKSVESLFHCVIALNKNADCADVTPAIGM